MRNKNRIALDTDLTFSFGAISKEEIAFESLSQEELSKGIEQWKKQEEIVKYKASIEKKIKSGRTKYLLKLFDFEDCDTWEDMVGDAGRILHELYRLHYVKKHILIAILDEELYFDEALNIMVGDAHEEERCY